MKHLLFSLIICCAALQGFSQASGLRVTNGTNCTVYYRIVGDELCRCGELYSSNIIALAPGGTAVYATSMALPTGSVAVPYPPHPASINAAYIYANPSCVGAVIGQVGEPPCGYPNIFSYLSRRPDCSPCSNVTAQWIPAPNCQQGMAQLRFN